MRALNILLFCGTVIMGSAGWTNPLPLDGIAAVINDSVITKSELSQQIKLVEQQLRQNDTKTPSSLALEKQVLDSLILNEIQLQLAKRTGIHVDEVALDNAIENIAKSNHLTVTQLREALTEQGVEFNHYRNTIRHQMIISQLQQRDVLSDIQVSEQEVMQFLQSPNGLGGMTNEYRLGHILVPLSEAPSPEEIDNATQLSQTILGNLRQGEDFAQVALAESRGSQALNGGDLGWRKLPELPTLFEKIVTQLKVGDIPEPIRSPSGFHVIKLLDKRSAAEQQTAIEKTLVRHLLIKTNAVTSDHDAKQRLMTLREKIQNGEDFGQLAKAHSADMASASNGGTIGWVTKDVLVPEFSNKMESLALNELSEPFKTPFGWHILQVLDRKMQTNDESAVKQKAKEMIRQRKAEEKLQAWSRQLRDEAFVKTQYDS